MPETTLKTSVLVLIHNGRKQVRLERLGRSPKVISLVKELLGSSRAPARRFTVRIEEREALGPEPGGRSSHWTAPG